MECLTELMQEKHQPKFRRQTHSLLSTMSYIFVDIGSDVVSVPYILAVQTTSEWRYQTLRPGRGQKLLTPC